MKKNNTAFSLGAYRGRAIRSSKQQEPKLFRRIIAMSVLMLMLGASCSPMKRIPFSRCEAVNGLAGPSDLAMENRSAFGGDRLIVASQERRDRDPEGEYLDSGSIKFIPLSGGNRNQVIEFSFSGRDEYPFHPEAIDILVHGGSKYLFVINHARTTQHAVEIFRIEKTSLVFMGRFRHRFIEYPSDIVGLGLDEFYLINKRSSSGLQHYGLSTVFTGSGSLIYYNNQTYYRLRSNLNEPEGLAMSPDQTRLWISLGGSGELLALERGSGTNLTELARIPVSGYPLRLTFSGSDSMLMASIESEWDWSSHATDRSANAPSRLLEVDATRGQSKVIYQDSGSEISGATVALQDGNRIYLGQKYDGFVLICNR